MRIYALALALLGILAVVPQPTQQCAVHVKYTLHSAAGPIVLDQACATVTSYAGGVLVIEAVDFGDAIFRSSFELGEGQ